MATTVFYLIALALPLWLVVEEIALHQRRETREPMRAAAAPTTAAPATQTA